MTQQVLTVVPKFTEELLRTNNCYSFMNFASLTSFLNTSTKNGVYYFCDGALMALAVRLLTGKKVERVSFDYTSIAHTVFNYASLTKTSVFVVGAEQLELDSFVKKIKERHPGLQVSGARSGYFKPSGVDDLYCDIRASGAAIVVAGLGAGKQEAFLSKLHASGYEGVSFSCGGFIRQEATAEKQYYPKIINKLGLRAFYRMYKEPHTIRRYALDYPKNMLRLFSGAIVGRSKILFMEND